MSKKHEVPWVIQEQTVVKHQLLEKYISPWMKILFQQQELLRIPQHLMYVDGFSGPGIYWTDDKKDSTCLGSPLIVANKANLYIEQNFKRKFDILCLDQDIRCVNLLTEKLKEFNRFNQNWEVVHAEFETKITSLLDKLESTSRHIPIFFFIDPFGYSDFSMTLLKRILSLPRTELFINFMIYDIIRSCEVDIFAQNMEKLFGSDEYKNVNKCSKPEEKQAYLINLYCRNLKSIGGARFVMPFRINTPGMGKRPRYYLVHASNNYKALKVMKDEMYKVSDAPYRFEAIGVATDQMSLFEDPQKTELRHRIDSFAKIPYIRELDYDKIEEWAYVNTNGVARTIKEALIELEKEKIVIINRKPRQQKSTVNSGAKIIHTGLQIERLF